MNREKEQQIVKERVCLEVRKITCSKIEQAY